MTDVVDFKSTFPLTLRSEFKLIFIFKSKNELESGDEVHYRMMPIGRRK